MNALEQFYIDLDQSAWDVEQEGEKGLEKFFYID